MTTRLRGTKRTLQPLTPGGKPTLSISGYMGDTQS